MCEWLACPIWAHCPFKVIPLRYNKLVSAFLPILEALLIFTFWYVLKLSAMTSEQVKIQQFWNELRCRTLQTQNIRKIAGHEPTDMPTSSATSLIVIRRFSITIFFTSSVFLLVVDVPLLDLLWRACTTCKHLFELQYTHRMLLSTFQVFLIT